ncbi:hypothetical protein IW261DRAFT_1554190 [Armillaria novae-zelandiae]|uniref:Uncharacterized protein n=1 Tax=Armillaria novae-zelandiae TaxID=153914 RepID=A0AA39TYS4_9AGAR|nr:hypothetical protein IW261DRAFT_1554190 [Armillaria novae-zelandiae]
MHRSSGVKHLKSSTHQNQVQANAQQAQDHLAAEQRYQQTYHGLNLPANQLFASRSNAPRPSLFNDLPNLSLQKDVKLQPEPPSEQYSWDEMIHTLHEHPVNLSCTEQEEFLERQFQAIIAHAQHLDQFGGDDDEEYIADELRALDLNRPEDEDLETYLNTSAQDTTYKPYPNKTLHIFLWLLHELGLCNVPSYDAFCDIQKTLRDKCGNEPIPYKSTAGNIFYVNDIRQSISRDFSNPEIAKHLQFYPEDTGGNTISEVWQANQWKEFDPSDLTPMFSRGHHQFYINEVTQLHDGRMVLPWNLIKYKNELCSDCSVVSISPNGWSILSGPLERITTSSFQYNYEDIVARVGNDISWIDCNPPVMPNPLRSLAEGDDLFVVMIPLWGDDVSGNKSKQYNKHINIYMENSCLPGQLLQQEYFVWFVSTSPNATSPEQFSALRDQINSTHKDPIKCYYARDGGHNCHQSEEACHMGGNANHPCRKCKIGGTAKEKETDEMYDQFYLPGEPRNAKEIRQHLEEQILQAMYGVDKDVSTMQTNTGTKDKVTQCWIDILLEKAKILRQEDPKQSINSVDEELGTWLKEQPGDKINPLLDIPGLDPSQDTPVELLHTVLLCIIKYVWHMLNSSWSDVQRNLIAIRLQSTNIDGYMIQYRNNLIGKHFKTLMQTLPFHVHGVVTPDQFTLVKAVSALSPLLWTHEIPKLQEYLNNVETLVGNVLDAFGDSDPAKIIIKIKLHLLTHICQDIQRFGPPIRNSTEVFEGFNAIFRQCSVLSNHQAPSHDIALKFASMDRLKHVLSGGFWWDSEKGWIQAGLSVLKMLRENPILQRHLGWVPASTIEPGQIQPQSQQLINKTSPICWKDTIAYSCLNAHRQSPSPESYWHQAISVTAQNGDRCIPGSWVFGHSLKTHEIICGHIIDILYCTSNEVSSSGALDTVIVIDLFVLGEKLHLDLECLVLCCPITNSQVEVLGALDILFLFDAQHDCRMAGCKATAMQACIQERQLTRQMQKLVAHKDEDHFIINTFGLHNAMLLRSALPCTLVTPIPLYSDCKTHHQILAKKVQETQTMKHAKTQEKRKATAATNKAKKQAQQAEIDAAERLQLEQDILDSDDKDGGDEIVAQPQKRAHIDTV